MHVGEKERVNFQALVGTQEDLGLGGLKDASVVK